MLAYKTSAEVLTLALVFCNGAVYIRTPEKNFISNYKTSPHYNTLKCKNEYTIQKICNKKLYKLNK